MIKLELIFVKLDYLIMRLSDAKVLLLLPRKRRTITSG